MSFATKITLVQTVFIIKHTSSRTITGGDSEVISLLDPLHATTELEAFPP